MSLDDLAKAQAQIEATVKERDTLALGLQSEILAHNRTKDRLQLVQVELEKAQADAKMYMRLSTKFATLVSNIHMLSAEAKKIITEVAKEELMEGETAQEREDATKIAERFAPEKREAYDPNLADGYAQKDGKTVLVRENRSATHGLLETPGTIR